jgi:hypothetical protein
VRAASADIDRGAKLKKTVGHAFAQSRATAGDENALVAQQIGLKHGETSAIDAMGLRAIVIQESRVSRSVGGSRLLFLAQFAANVRPELLYHIGEGVVTNLCSPNAGSVEQSAIGAGMVALMKG